MIAPPVAAQSSDELDPVIDPHDACPDETNPRAPFSDRDTIASVHVLNVDCAYNNDITVGFDNGTFGPLPSVTRGQFASFLVRTLRAVDVDLPDPSDHGFTDIAGSGHVESINILANTSIAEGVTATTFAPGDPLTREQTATFAMRAAAMIQGIPLSSIQRPTGPFDDIDEASGAHTPNINGAAHFGITTGVTVDTYEPRAETSRQQMASFLVRILASLRDDGVLIPPEDIVENVEFPNDFAVNPVGTDHSPTALATDINGDPVANAQIRFEVFRNTDVSLEASPLHSDATFTYQPGLTTTAQTGQDGTASITYTGPDHRADDRIAACVVRGPVAGASTDSPVCGIVVATDNGQDVIATSAVPAAVAQKIWGYPADAIDVTARGLYGELLGITLVDTPTSAVSLPGDGAVAEDSDGATLGVLQGVLDAGLITTRAAGDLHYGLARGEATTADLSLNLGPVIDLPVVCDLLPLVCGLLSDLLEVELVEAGAINVVGNASCEGPYTDLGQASDSTFVGLTVLGNELPVDVPPNTGISLDGVVSVVINEVVPSSTAGEVGYTVTGVRVDVLDNALIDQIGGGLNLRIGEVTTAMDCADTGMTPLGAAELTEQDIENDDHINWVTLDELAELAG